MEDISCITQEAREGSKRAPIQAQHGSQRSRRDGQRSDGMIKALGSGDAPFSRNIAVSVQKGAESFRERREKPADEGRTHAARSSQTDLAERVGATRQTIGLIEAGRYNPSLKLCTAICKTLGVTLNDLFWDEDATS